MPLAPNNKITPIQTRILAAEQLKTLISHCLEKNPVMAPQQRKDQPGYHHFDWLDSPEDLDINFTTTTIPPKNAFFPTREPLFRFEGDSPANLEVIEEKQPFTLFGVHPCDLAAISRLDAAYSHPPADMRWANNRRRATIVGIDCIPDAYCFCTSMGTCAVREPCDLFLTEIRDGYLAEIHSPKGEALIDSIPTKTAHGKDLLDARRFQEAKEAATTSRLNTTIHAFSDILRNHDHTDTWKETARRCYSCGSCNTTCPTCFCFDMHDTLNADLNSGSRYRTWGSCQLLDFAVIAGGDNMRADRWQRVRHRWHRKFLYLYSQFGHPYCTGCGRCSRACTADINIVDVSNQLISDARKKES